VSRLILVKHAMPAVDPTRPAPTWLLSDTGRDGARAFASRLSPFAPSRIVASVEPKAAETARILGGELSLPVAADRRLVEHRREGAGYQERVVFEAQIAALFAHPDQRVFGAESADEAEARFAAAVADHAQDGLVVVAHGTVISLWVSRRFGVEPMTLWSALTLPSAVVADEAAGRYEIITRD